MARILFLLAFASSLSALLLMVLHTIRAGHRPLRSTPRGSAARGVLYAFTTGMMPWEKESAGRHMPTFVAGIFYHAGVFAFLVYTLRLVLFPGVEIPMVVFRILLFAGGLAGVGLLLKRATMRHLRAISCPDDFASNALVDACLLLAAAHSYVPGLETWLLAASSVLFVYIPIGKIRHCFFFFYTRILFGKFFGRRGVFPARKAGL